MSPYGPGTRRLDDELALYDRVLREWSIWPDFYQVAEDGNRQFAARNLSPAVMLAVVRRCGLNSKMRLLREGESADEFYQRADAALYRAKAAGRDRLTE